MPAVNPTHHFLNYPKSEIGSYAANLADLATQNIPLPITYCIPISTLKTIAQQNHLDTKFDQIIKKININSQTELEKTTKQVQELILDLAYPTQVSNKILELYDKYFEKDFIRLTASPVDGNPLDYKREDMIKGEANMMDSILKLWAKNIDPLDIKRNNLYPVAIIIQSQFQPDVSGLAYSLNINTGDKAHLTIQSVYGVFSADESLKNCDHFFVDRRSWKVQEKAIANKQTAFIRSLDKLEVNKVYPQHQSQPSLNTTQLTELAKLVNKIKLKFTHQILIHWELIDEQFLITKIKPYQFTQGTHFDTEKLKTVLIGQSFNSGYITGKVHILNTKKDISQFKPGYIAVLKELTDSHLSIIQNCSAIICEKGIKSDLILNKIRYYQLPTIIFAKNATSILKDNQLIVADTSAGKVYTHTQKKPIKKADTKLQFLLATNNPSAVNNQTVINSDGVGLIRGEQLFIKTGKHPQIIINTERKKFVESVSNDLITLYHRYYSINKQIPLITYRACNLDTNQLAKLESGTSYEIQEKNPFLGFRGALRTINKPSIFELELEILSRVNSKLDQPISLMLPFVRTSFELKQVWDQVENLIDSPVYQPPIWLQLNTPENLLNIKEYLAVPLSAICINIKTVHALLHGIDPYSPEIVNYYPTNHQLLLPMIKKVIDSTKNLDHQIGVYLIMSDFDQQIVEFAKQQEIKGLIAPWELLSQSHSYLTT